MSAYQMSEDDRGRLRKNRIYLLKNVKMTTMLLDYLEAQRVLTDDMKEEILAETTTKSKIGKMLDTLNRRGPNAFPEFISALMEDEQEHVAFQLDESLAAKWQKENPRQVPTAPSATHHRGPSRQTSRPKPTQKNWHKASKNEQQTGLNNESAILSLDVVPVDTDDTTMWKLINDHQNVYEMKRKPRGRAIIINNSYFVSSPKRGGSQFDSQNLCMHFDNLGFETVLHDDQTADEIRLIIEDERTLDDHWNADCFVMFVLSHGAKGYVYGIDGCKLSIEQDIVTPFDGNNCEALVRKPKMFFIQACQGDTVSTGVEDLDESEVDASPIPEQSRDMEQAFRDLRIQDTEATIPHIGRSHEKSDIVLAYSTVPGYRSWRRTDLGSWFVRAIVEVFSLEAHKEDLLSLLVKVRQRVSENYTNHENAEFIQLTRTDETTKKKIYFFPGYYEERKGDTV